GGVQRANLARDDPQAGRPTLLARPLEGQLQPQADAQNRRARREPLAQQLIEPELTQVAHRARKRSHAGQDQPVGAAQALLLGRHARPRADVLERLLDRTAVAHAVVHDGYLHGLLDQRAHALNVPFVLGTPCSLGSIATAWRSARAKALNAASIMWWAFEPASTRRWSVSLAVLASARKNSSVSSCSKPPVEPGGSCASNGVNGRPEASIAQLARASSIGTVAQP